MTGALLAPAMIVKMRCAETQRARDDRHACCIEKRRSETGGRPDGSCRCKKQADLRAVFRKGSRAFLLNPPARPARDTDAEERANVESIIEALKETGLQKVVAASTYGARPGERCGDLTVLHEFEQKLLAQSIPVAINRAAYYMSNWLGMIDAVREQGKLPSLFPADFALPMVAPADVGENAARRMLEPASETGLCYVEGPRRYTPRDVADAFSIVVGRPVEVQTIPRESWEASFVQFGFSQEAAASYACMTGTVLDDAAAIPEDPVRGTTTLQKHIRQALNQAKG